MKREIKIYKTEEEKVKFYIKFYERLNLRIAMHESYLNQKSEILYSNNEPDKSPLLKKDRFSAS